MFLASSRPRRPGAYAAEAFVASCARSVTHLTRCAPSRARRLLGSGRRCREYAAELRHRTLGGGAGRLLDVRRRDVLPALRRFAFHLELQHARLADAAAVHLALV